MGAAAAVCGRSLTSTTVRTWLADSRLDSKQVGVRAVVSAASAEGVRLLQTRKSRHDRESADTAHKPVRQKTAEERVGNTCSSLGRSAAALRATST